MTFDQLQPGEKIFIDANIFVYHVNGISSECKHFLSRCSQKEIIGYTSTFVLAEILHRLMIAEAIRKKYIRTKNPVQQLKKHPEVVKQLSDYIADVVKIREMNVKILDLTPKCIEESANIRKTEGLLTNDSLIVATMKQASFSKLATNDDDFDNIAWLDIYKPSDV